MGYARNVDGCKHDFFGNSVETKRDMIVELDKIINIVINNVQRLLL